MTVQESVVRTALIDQLTHKTYWSICTLDKCAEVLGRRMDKGPGSAYCQLDALHCIHYANMPRDLVEILPDLIRQALGSGVEIPRLEAPKGGGETYTEVRPGAVRRLLGRG